MTDAPRPAYRLAYLDPDDPRRAFMPGVGTGATRDEALAPIREMLSTATAVGAVLPPYAVLTDLDVLATDERALELALRTDPALDAICRYVSEQARTDERDEPAADAIARAAGTTP